MKRWSLRFRSSSKRYDKENNLSKSNANSSGRVRDEGNVVERGEVVKQNYEQIQSRISLDGESSLPGHYQSACMISPSPQDSTLCNDIDSSEVDRSVENKAIQQAEENSLSYSIDSSLQSKTTMSTGSTLPQDSFIVGSTTGLSSVASSSRNSFYPCDAFSVGDYSYGEEDRIEFRSRKVWENVCYQRGQSRTSRLPRLTVPSRHTQGYLEQTSANQRNTIGAPLKHKTKSTHTEPRTHRGELDKQVYEQIPSEFPNSSQDETPRLQMHVDTSHEQNSISEHFLNTSESKFINSLLRNTGSSLGSEHYATNTSTDQMKRENKAFLNATIEKEFWTMKLREAATLYGEESVEVARQLNNLGSSLLRCKEYAEAMLVFKKVIGIMSHNYDDNSLAFARALDKVGLAASMSSSQKNLDWALLALKEALHLRLAHLGPHHSDTVDSLNNIAGVFLRKKAWSDAKEAYIDVITVRAAIFGQNHPSVAVTAQTLGKVCSHLSEFQSSLKYYNIALSIYREEPTCLKEDHPIMKKIFRNIDRTERLMMSLGFEKLH